MAGKAFWENGTATAGRTSAENVSITFLAGPHGGMADMRLNFKRSLKSPTLNQTTSTKQMMNTGSAYQETL